MPRRKRNGVEERGAGTTRTKRRRVKVSTGQLIAVPLLDGSYALLHVALYNGRIIGAHYAHRGVTPDALAHGLDDALGLGPLAILAVTADEVSDGHWPVIGHTSRPYPAEMLDMKGISHTASMSRHLFNAYHGLLPWDGMHDPRCYEKMLLPGVPVPPTVRYKRDFEKEAAAATASAPKSCPEPAVTEGPAEIHIEIRYPGDALPSLDLLHRRQALERSLEEAGAGEVTDAGGGGGVMDVYLQTHDIRQAMPLVETAIKAAGFEKDATIEASARSDAGDEDA